MSSTSPLEGQITVSMPYYRCPGTVARAVDSVLAQTYSNLMLVVVNDGDPDPPWDLLADVDDDRFVRFDVGHNRGRYFADAVVLHATETDWFFVHDADDYCEAELLETYLALALATDAEAVFGAHIVHGRRSDRPKVQQFTRLLEPVTDRPADVAPHQALFRTDLLRSIGGYYAGLRIGFDTLLINLVRMTARIAYTDAPLYHRVSRSGSLTSSPETGFGSEARRQAARHIAEIYRDVHGSLPADGQGTLELRARMAAAIARRVTDGERQQLDSLGANLRTRLMHAGRPRPCSLASYVDRPTLFTGGWAIHRELAAELSARLQSRPPRAVLELGSGDSTVLLAAYAARTGARAVTLEHDAGFADQTRKRLRAEGLQDHIELVVAPLTRVRCGDVGSFFWYRHALTYTFDFVLVDGPPERYGREAALFSVQGHLADGWEAWLDDAGRPHERSCLRLWRESLGVAVTEVALCCKALAIVTAAPQDRGDAPPADVLVALQVGSGPRSGPEWLDHWAAACNDVAASLLERATVLATAADRRSRDPLRQCPWIDSVVEPLPGARSTTSALLAAAVSAGSELVLHVSDGWTAASADRSGLATAEMVLSSRADLGQVRLMHAGEAVRRRHSVTGRSIGWTRHSGWAASSSAHFTLYPSLVRSSDLARLLPIRDEGDAQRRFHALGLGSAMLLPGLFHRRLDGRDDRMRENGGVTAR